MADFPKRGPLFFLVWLFLSPLIHGVWPLEAAPKSGGTLVFARGGDSVRLDPADVTDGESTKVISNIFDTLVQYKENTTEIEPSLALHWQTADEGKKWIFHLRQGVKFHDGTPFNAEAVVFSLKRQMKKDDPEFGGEFIFWDSMFKEVLDVKALDEATVEITLKNPSAPFLANLAMHNAAIISPTAMKKHGKKFAQNPVGTGAFIFDKWIPKEKIVLKANPDYWGGRPYLDQVLFLPVEENSVRTLKMVAGEVDGMDGVSSNDLATLEDKKDSLQILSQPGMNVGYLAMNTQKPPFDKLNVRKAVAMAINKKLLVKTLYKGTAIPAVTPLPPGVFGHDGTLTDIAYNPDEAKKLLEAEGLKEGFEMELYMMPIPRPYMPQPKNIAQAIQSSLEMVGIRAKLVTFEWGTYLEKTENGEHDACLLGWTGDNGDPDNFLYVLLDQDNAKKGSASNLSFFHHEPLHQLLINGQRELNPVNREKLYKEAQKLILDNVPMVPLAHANQILVFKKRVKDFKIHPTARVNFHKVWLDE